MLLLLSLVVALAACCHPECRYQCDDPVCAAVGKEVCLPPSCTVRCGSDSVSVCRPPVCKVRCAKDQCESDSCPVCETICEPLVCAPLDESCEIECLEVECSWKCHKPTHCPKPTCVLQCDEPACVFTPSTASSLLFPKLVGTVMLAATQLI